MKSFNFIIRSLLIIFMLSGALHSKTMTILVHPFSNTGDSKFSWLSAGMTESVISDLGKIQDVTVIAEIDRKKAIREMEFAMTGFVDDEKTVKTGKALGADIIFTGSYTVIGNLVRVNARLMDVEKMSVEKTVKIDGTFDKIFDLQDRIVFTLMAETEKINIADIKPVKLRKEDRKKIEQEVRPAFSAFELYAKGLEIKDANPREALNYFKQALDIDPYYIDALQEAGFTAGNILNLFNEAIEYLSKAEKILIKKGDLNTAQYSSLIRNIGVVYWSKGNLDKALENYMKSKEIQDRLGLQNTLEHSKLMMHIGVLNWSKGDFNKALEYHMKSKEIQEKLSLKNTTEYSNLLMNIGNSYLSKSSLDKALENYIKTKEILNRLGLQNTTMYSKLMMNIGNVHQRRDELDKALESYLKSKEIQERIGLQNTALYSGLMMNIGVIYSDKRDLVKSLEYYMKSKEIKDMLGLQNTAGYGNMLYNMAVIYGKQGDENKSGEYFRKAYDSYSKAGYIGISKDDALKNAERLGK